MLTVDIGAGEGRVSRELVRRGHRIVAVDASATLAAAAHQGEPAALIAVADAAALPLRDGVADLAVAFMSFQDVDDLRGVPTTVDVATVGGCEEDRRCREPEGARLPDRRAPERGDTAMLRTHRSASLGSGGRPPVW